MIQMNSFLEDILLIIPARGGSKRIPKKNSKLICNQPMLFWPLMELSELFPLENIIISTDDNEIIEIVKSKGLDVPFIRPKILCDDYTGTVPVAQHALDWFQKNRKKVSYVLIVYPTAVLINKFDVLQAIQTLKESKDLDFIMSATLFPSSI
jgi:N-acylneuraminate cytidylyltransferase